MSLDLSIMNDDGTPGLTVSLGLHEHHALMTVALAAGLRQLSKMRDYYGEVEWSGDHLDEMLRELQQLKADSSASEVLGTLEKLRDLAAVAKRDEREIIALPD